MSAKLLRIYLIKILFFLWILSSYGPDLGKYSKAVRGVTKETIQGSTFNYVLLNKGKLYSVILLNKGTLYSVIALHEFVVSLHNMIWRCLLFNFMEVSIQARDLIRAFYECVQIIDTYNLHLFVSDCMTWVLRDLVWCWCCVTWYGVGVA